MAICFTWYLLSGNPWEKFLLLVSEIVVLREFVFFFLTSCTFMSLFLRIILSYLSQRLVSNLLLPLINVKDFLICILCHVLTTSDC